MNEIQDQYNAYGTMPEWADETQFFWSAQSQEVRTCAHPAETQLAEWHLERRAAAVTQKSTNRQILLMSQSLKSFTL
jgi:hypothetical protein